MGGVAVARVGLKTARGNPATTNLRAMPTTRYIRVLPALCRAAMSWAQHLKRVFGIDIEMKRLHMAPDDDPKGNLHKTTASPMGNDIATLDSPLLR